MKSVGYLRVSIIVLSKQLQEVLKKKKNFGMT